MLIVLFKHLNFFSVDKIRLYERLTFRMLSSCSHAYCLWQIKFLTRIQGDLITSYVLDSHIFLKIFVYLVHKYIDHINRRQAYSNWFKQITAFLASIWAFLKEGHNLITALHLCALVSSFYYIAGSKVFFFKYIYNHLSNISRVEPNE